LDIQDPHGAGRRKRSMAKTSGNAEEGKAVLVRRESLVRRDEQRNFFPVYNDDNNDKNNDNDNSNDNNNNDNNTNNGNNNSGKVSKATDFGDNVGLTVILPGGKIISLESILKEVDE